MRKLALPVLPISNSAVATRIVEGRVTPLPGSYSDEPEAPVFLRAQNIEEGFLNFTDAKRLTPESFDAEPEAMLVDGDIVLTIDGVLLGKAAVHRTGDDPCCVSNHMVRILHGTRTNPDFLTWFLNSPIGQKQIKRGITGSAIPGIRTDAIGRILVPLPKPQKQRKLVAEMQAARSARKQKLRKADELLASLDTYLLETLGIIVPASDARNVFAVRLQQIEGALNPERYAGLRLAKCVTGTKVGIVARILDAKISPAKEEPSIEWDRIRIDDLPNQPLDIETIHTTPGSELEETYFEVQGNDILLARLGPTILNSKFILCPPLRRRTVASSEFLVLRCREDWKPEVVLWILRTKLFRDIMYSKCRGGTPSRYRLNAEDAASIPFPQIASDVQQQIAAEVRSRREQARRLRSDAEADWAAAKRRFEEQLLAS